MGRRGTCRTLNITTQAASGIQKSENSWDLELSQKHALADQLSHK